MKHIKYLFILSISIKVFGMQESIKPGIYQHSKSGKKYEVIGIARYSEDPHKEFVIYKQLYDSALHPEGTKLPAGTLWVRPKEMFLELVEISKGVTAPRFKKIDA
jgi:hypothetical protein